jgi:hypothetical protein
MTILDQIAREAKALPAQRRQEALQFLRSIRTPSAGLKKPARKTLGQARSAIHAAQGMWRNRTDLPSDTIEASIELRRRMMRRASNDD